MDFKALRAKRNDKARSLIESSGGKVDSSTWTPDEMLNADVKTGMRPISRRAFKAGGKVEGEDAKSNLSRSPRGFKETVGLANTNQKDANEEREGKKHVGGFKRGGRTGYQDAGFVSGEELGEGSEPAPNPSGRPSQAEMDRGQAALDAQTRADKAEEGRQALRDMGDKTRRKDGGRTAKAGGGSFKEKFAAERKKQGSGGTFEWNGKSYSTNYAEEEQKKPAMSGKSAATGKAKELYDANLKAVTDPNGRKESVDIPDVANDAINMAKAKDMGLNDVPRPMKRPAVAPVEVPMSKGITPDAPITVEPLKRGGMAKKKYEGSPKDNLLDAKMAKKKGMTHKEWEKSPEDKRMDAKGQREMNMRAKKMGGGGMEMLSPAARLMKDPKSMSPAGMLASGMKKGGAAKDHDDDCSCKACGGRMGRATGGRTKGTTNISINVMPHSPNKPMGIQPPMPPMPPPPPVGGPPPMGGMPPPPPAGGGGGLPPGLMAAMSGAAGDGPPPRPSMGMPPPPMGRKAGGKVYPIDSGAGGAKARLDKIKAYGLKQK